MLIGAKSSCNPALLALNYDYARWAVALLDKCCYKWQPRKYLGLDVTNLVIYVSKNGETINENHKTFLFF
jgi:hypothetical protein